MDENDGVECETKIPNHSSPDVVKAQAQQKLETIENSVKEHKKVDDTDEKENSDPLNVETNGTNNAQDCSSIASQEVVDENELSQQSSSRYDHEPQSSDQDDAVELITESDEEQNEKLEINEDDIPRSTISVQEKTLVPESEVEAQKESRSELETVRLVDLGSDEEDDSKLKENFSNKNDVEIKEDNLYDDLDEIKPAAVDLSGVVQAQENDLAVNKEDSEQMEVCVDPIPLIEQPKIDIKCEPQKQTSRKRSRSPSPNVTLDHSEPVMDPSKRLRRELEDSYGQHNKILREYIETSSHNSSLEEVQKHIDAIDAELKTLEDMLRAKEDEWNNMIHLKKVKEEIRLRLYRKKNILEITNSSISNDPTAFSSSTPIQNKSHPQLTFNNNTSLLQNTLKNSTNSRKEIPSNAGQQNAVNVLPLSVQNNALNAIAQSIVSSRANMKTADLAKEKTIAAKIQR